MKDAACKDHPYPDAFFPVGPGAHAGPVRIFCGNCPVREQCLDYGLMENYGIWGGTSERERRRIRRERRSPKPPTHCRQGHPLTSENTFVQNKGSIPGCRECKNAQARAHQRRKRLAS
jgi:WhiB family redox-sensing transcriptional regulator